jgi:hypothetical protein
LFTFCRTHVRPRICKTPCATECVSGWWLASSAYWRRTRWARGLLCAQCSMSQRGRLLWPCPGAVWLCLHL